MGLTLVGCASRPSPAFQSALEAAQAEERAGRVEEAARGLQHAADIATRRKDRDEALFLRGEVFRDAGRRAEARATWQALVQTSPDGPRTARASYELVRIELEEAGLDRATEALETLLRQYPDEGFSPKALRELTSLQRQRLGDDGTLVWLSEFQRLFGDLPLAQVAGYGRAQLLEELRRLDEAREAYVAAGRKLPYPRGPLTDDAFWRAAGLDVAAGRLQEALNLLEELVAPREQAFEGSYTRPRFPEAQLEIARLRAQLHDERGAIEAYARLMEYYPQARQWDDAAWEAARLFKGRGEKEQACSLANALAAARPESRYVGCLPRLCETLRPTDGSECRDYVVRSASDP